MVWAEGRSAHAGHACCSVKTFGCHGVSTGSKLGKCLRMMLQLMQFQLQDLIYSVAVRDPERQDVEFAC